MKRFQPKVYQNKINMQTFSRNWVLQGVKTERTVIKNKQQNLVMLFEVKLALSYQTLRVKI